MSLARSDPLPIGGEVNSRSLLMTSPAVAASESIEPVETERRQEAELVELALQGVTDAAQQLVQRHHQRIYRFVWQLTRQAQDAEDITQETFIKAFKSLHRFDPTRPLSHWLFTIARRTALNHFRSARRWVALPDETVEAEPSPAVRAETHDQVDDLWTRARALLSEREFEVLWLRFGESLSTEETAQVVRLTQAHVKVIVFRARQRLLDKLPLR